MPTVNRSQTAVETVHAWQVQLAPYDAEIIVVDDGSRDDHAAYLQAGLRDLPRVQIIEQAGAGLAAARNAAIEASGGSYVFFVDDDIRPGNETTLQQAFARVRETKQPVSGRIRVPKAYRSTVVQELWHQHQERKTAAFTDEQALAARDLRFAALLMPRKALQRERFHTAFHNSAWAERDLSNRVYQLGTQAQFHGDLWFEHHDMVTLSGLLKKYEALGTHAVPFAILHPDTRTSFLTGTAWLSRVVKTVLAYGPRGDCAVKKLAEYADERFVGDPEALAVLSRDLFTALEGAYFRGTLAALHDRKRR